MAEKDCRRAKGKLFPTFGNCPNRLSANPHVQQTISACPAALRHISDTGQQTLTSKPDKNTAPTLFHPTLIFYPRAISSRICPSESPAIRHLKLFPLNLCAVPLKAVLQGLSLSMQPGYGHTSCRPDSPLQTLTGYILYISLHPGHWLCLFRSGCKIPTLAAAPLETAVFVALIEKADAVSFIVNCPDPVSTFSAKKE